jgi:FMN-dependent NADH-azoreductase
MNIILHVACSPLGHAAESHRLARTLIAALLEKHPGAVVVDRVMGGVAIPPIDADYAVSQGGDADVSQAGSMALSDVLADELEAADAVVISTPMHNYTAPAALKAWIDHVVRVRRTFDVSAAGKIGRLADRPVFIAIASGGRFGEHTRQPDFLTPWLAAILGMIGLHDLSFFTVQGTAFGEDYLAQSRREADLAVRAHLGL